MVVQGIHHFLHLLENVVEIGIRSVYTTVIDPGNLGLDDDAHPVAEAECVIIMRVMGKAEEIAAKFLHNFIVLVIIRLPQSRSAPLLVLVHPGPVKRIGLPVQEKSFFAIEPEVTKSHLGPGLILPSLHRHRIEIGVRKAVP